MNVMEVKNFTKRLWAQPWPVFEITRTAWRPKKQQMVVYYREIGKWAMNYETGFYELSRFKDEQEERSYEFYPLQESWEDIMEEEGWQYVEVCHISVKVKVA